MTNSCRRHCSGNLLKEFLLLAPCPPPNGENLFWSEVDRLGLHDTEITVIVDNCQIRYRSVTVTYPLSEVCAATASINVTRITTVQDTINVSQSTAPTMFKNTTDLTSVKENVHATRAVINKAVTKPGKESLCEQSCVYGIISTLCQRRVSRKHNINVVANSEGITEELPWMPNHRSVLQTQIEVRSIETDFFDVHRESQLPESDLTISYNNDYCTQNKCVHEQSSEFRSKYEIIAVNHLQERGKRQEQTVSRNEHED
ncbi:hypothetical protein CHS0354_042684 [Potamilus streckersoni]|uniref:Uncharacterized protein n=1 Tax=Potamilus streckersoni TaxID=2493646 RepID=A0AAE0VRB4_9BIVA|nr:hypothetical protein CHS0354_042684 [Potamilus streckersoni]